MSKSIGTIINQIMDEHSTRQIAILTNHMYIIGDVLEIYEKCESCDDCLLTLKDVKILRIDDMCNCIDANCDCKVEPFIKYKWFNINSSNIVGFSIL